MFPEGAAGYAIIREITFLFMSRILRQIIVACVFLVILGILLVGVYYAFIKAPETCVDGKKNQNEQGIDCGGACRAVCQEVVVGKDIQLKEVAFVEGGQNRYDVFGKILNGNSDIGATKFRYTFELRDGSGRVLATRSGENYILPQETKSLIELNLETASVPVSVTLALTEVVWERLSGYQEKPNVSIYQKRYAQVTEGFGYAEAYGLLSNESPYDFRSILVGVILRDGTGRPVALNTTTQNTIKAGESRDFKLVWPLPFPGTVSQIDMEIDADVYHSENFIEQYFPGGSSR